MKKLSIAVFIGLLLAGTGFYVKHGFQVDQAEVALPPAPATVWQLPEVANSANENIESEFEFDSDRLFDLSYQTDPDLAAFADNLGLSVGCIVATAQYRLHGFEIPDGACRRASRPRSVAEFLIQPGEYADECQIVTGREVCHRVKIADHPYEQYTDSELESLAIASPEAAVILARRIQNIVESEKYYERAVVLSGKPGPLGEWMMHRNIGGLSRRNGVLNVSKAELGLEIYLTMEALGYPVGGSVEYARVLAEEGLDLEPIRERANIRISRLTQAREDILGIGGRI